MRDSFSEAVGRAGGGGDEVKLAEPQPHPRQTTYIPGGDHPSGLLGEGGSVTPTSDEDGEQQQHERM